MHGPSLALSHCGTAGATGLAKHHDDDGHGDGNDYGYGAMQLSTQGGMRVLNYTFTGAVDKKLYDHWMVVKPF